MKKGVSISLRAGAVVLFAGYLAAVAWHGLTSDAAEHRHNDAEWAMKAYRWPTTQRESTRWSRDEFVWETAGRCLYRWYSGAIVRATGHHAACANAMLVFQIAGQGLKPGDPEYIDPAVLRTLRAANLLLFAGMLGLLALVALKLFDNTFLATLCLVPVAASPTFWNCVAWRPGPDALLCLMLVAVLAAWLMLSGWKQFVIVSILAGLACASKQSGVLVLGAWCGWLVSTGRGAGRAWRSFVALLIAGAVFCLVTPQTWVAPWSLLVQTAVRATHDSHVMAARYGPHTWWQLWTSCTPLWPLLPVYAWLLWRCSRSGSGWLAPVAWWGGVLTIGTLATIPSPETRYLAPLEMGLYFPAMLCALHLASRGGGRFQKAGGTA